MVSFVLSASLSIPLGHHWIYFYPSLNENCEYDVDIVSWRYCFFFFFLLEISYLSPHFFKYFDIIDTPYQFIPKLLSKVPIIEKYEKN